MDVAGGQSTGTGEGCYGNSLALPPLRAMAGFPHDKMDYILPRAGLTPSDTLQQCVFMSGIEG